MDVHHVVVAGTDELRQTQRPASIGALRAQAVGAHARGLEFADQVILPRQHVGALDLEPGQIVGAGCRNEQRSAPPGPSPFTTHRTRMVAETICAGATHRS
jgi:hypothetical protein